MSGSPGIASPSGRAQDRGRDPLRRARRGVPPARYRGPPRGHDRTSPAGVGFRRHLRRAGREGVSLRDRGRRRSRGAHRGGPALPTTARQPGDREVSRVAGSPVVTARVGVVLFPGSNCEHDVVEALEQLGAEAEILWHGDRALRSVDAVVPPAGFASGDYLRPAALAGFSPIRAAVTEFAATGGPVVGICNGFQVLTEAHLLPGALQKNVGLTFLCTPVEGGAPSARAV